FIVCISVLSFFMLTPKPPEIAPEVNNIDKVEHVIAFLILTILFRYSICSKKIDRPIFFVVLTVLILCSYGVLIEYLQGFTGRSRDIADVFSDMAGVLGGCLLMVLI
ncbi:MAG: VanZ family protein, partial [Spirochaetales bacterium]|nr:VanZ family protein [Spirochaetales bacterium]